MHIHADHACRVAKIYGQLLQRIVKTTENAEIGKLKSEYKIQNASPYSLKRKFSQPKKDVASNS